MAIHARSQLDLVMAINVLATITDKNKDEAGVKSIIKTLMCGFKFLCLRKISLRIFLVIHGEDLILEL